MANPTEQIPLSFPYNEAMSREDLWVGACNQQAVEWLDNWRNWQALGLVLYGEQASGKTHLAKVWQASSGAKTLASDDEIQAFLHGEEEGAATSLLVDDADQRDEELLFHLYNHLFNSKDPQAKLLLTAEKPPKLWGMRLKDLQSRLLSLPSVEIRPPDEETLIAVFMKQCHDRQMVVDEGVIPFVMLRLERSFGAVSALVEALDERSLALKRRVTVPLVREVLTDSTAA